MKQAYRTVSLLVAACALTGCYTTPVATGFLPDYQNLARVGKSDIYMQRVDDANATKPPAIIAVNAVGWGAKASDTEDAETIGELEKALVRHCYSSALELYPSPTMVTWEDDLALYMARYDPIYRLEVAVTDIKRGNGFLRYFLGYYAGTAAIQGEFRLREAKTNRLLATFACRRYAPGPAYGGFNLMVFSSNYCLMRETERMAYDILPVVADALEGVDDTEVNAPVEALLPPPE